MNKEIDLHAIRRLFRMTIIQAFEDIIYGNNRIKEEVLEWIDTEDYLNICNLAEANPEEIKYKLLNNPKETSNLFKDLQAKKFPELFD